MSRAAATLDKRAKVRSSAGLWKMWREDVACVRARDPAARNALEVVLTYPRGRRLAHRLWRAGVKFPARLISWRARFLTNLDHRLIADPVGEALSLVLDRVDFLKARLDHMPRRLKAKGSPGGEKLEG